MAVEGAVHDGDAKNTKQPRPIPVIVETGHICLVLVPWAGDCAGLQLQSSSGVGLKQKMEGLESWSGEALPPGSLQHIAIQVLARC